MSDKPRLFLHIGYHKTGSTSLQTSFGENRALLRQHRICYPEGTPKAPHKHAAVGNSIRRLARKGADHAPAVERMVDELHRTAEDDGCDTVVLSNEGYSPIDPAQIAGFGRLRRLFDVTVVAAVRRQDAYLQSWYQQLIKEGRFNGTFLEFIRGEDWSRLQYTQAMARWAEVFDPENIRLLSFDLENDRPGRIHRALVDLMTHGRLTEELPERDWNRSYPSIVHEIWRRASFIEAAVPERETYVTAMHRMRYRDGAGMEHPVFRRKYLTDALRYEVLRMFEDDNARLTQEYFGGVDPFPGFDRDTLPPAPFEDENPGNGFSDAEIAFAAMEMVRLKDAMITQLRDGGAESGPASRPGGRAGKGAGKGPGRGQGKGRGARRGLGKDGPTPPGQAQTD